MFKITNCVNDRSKEHLRRSAPGFIMEPSIGGVRLRIGESMNLDDAHFEQNRKLLEGWEKKGIVTIEQVGGAAPKPASDPAPLPPPPTPTEEPGAGAASAETAAETSSETKTDEPAPTEIKKGSGKKKLF